MTKQKRISKETAENAVAALKAKTAIYIGFTDGAEKAYIKSEWDKTDEEEVNSLVYLTLESSTKNSISLPLSKKKKPQLLNGSKRKEGKNFPLSLQKTIDKSNILCYNKDRKKQGGKENGKTAKIP